ncbi:hypothetical protein [Paenibacillus methanolicus]|uniref:Lycopene cyclase domain-containing protein n=1 Tax=Paenibacillus methanolicus TaxID=582686 RepID=A0A5S5BTT6_9BACL|nr:hypothetical protein [Paenibacillus methanolicus]TYP69612.1 hypothetical protein BCM02_114129 [Paenibacillus methanolicus]
MWDQIWLWAILIGPWLTLFLMRGETIKRYVPVAVFTALIVTIIFEIAYVRRWWEMTERIVPWGTITNVSFVYGAFFVGTMWIFALAYRNLGLFLLTNLAIDAIQAFVLSPFLFEGRWYSLVNLNNIQVFALMFGISIVIYMYQGWQERIFRRVEQEYTASKAIAMEMKLPLTRRGRAR